MKKLNVFLLTILTIFLSISCEIGLGSAVDTEPPSIEISNPPVDTIVRGDFAVCGTWSDDGSIASVTVTLSRTDGKGTPVKCQAVVAGGEGGKGTWRAPINPAEAGILDGSYEALVEITDGAGHKTTQPRTFAVDNTPPLIVLQRPGTKITETPDAYGQTFTLNGMGADDNSIDHIDINIYSDADCTNLLKTITKSNVPPTIQLDVAVFEEGIENDYATIYGSATKNGAQVRYCTITAYDNAKRYSGDGEQTDADKKGNSTTNYYLYDDIYDTVLDHYTINDVYKMLSGTYLLADTNRSADTVTNVKSLLNQYKIEKSNFSLDPENSPQFFVNGRDPLTGAASDFEGSDYNITSGSSVVIEVATGLDGIPLEPGSICPYLLPCIAGGFTLADGIDIPENRIYLAEAGSGTKSGTSYKYTVNFDHTTAYPGEKFITLGSAYIIRVEGHDKNGNIVRPKGGEYGFKLASNGSAPGLTVTSPANALARVKANGSQIFSGIVTCQDGFPTISIKNGDTTIWSKTFVSSDLVVVNGVNQFNFTYNLSYEGVTENNQIQYTLEASIGDLKTLVYKTVIYDKDAPDIDIGSILPVAQKYNVATESTLPEAGEYLNGVVTLKLTVTDGYDVVDTTTEGKIPYFEVIEVADDAAQTESVKNLWLNKVGLTNVDIVSETNFTDKHYIKKLINANIDIDTTDIQTATDTGDKKIKFKVHAWDMAGNEKVYTYPVPTESNPNPCLIVSQETDKPVIIPAGDLTFTRFAYTLSNDSDNPNPVNQDDNRKTQVSSGGNIQFFIYDDDKIDTYKVWWVPIASNSETKEQAASRIESAAEDTTNNRTPTYRQETGLSSTELTKSVNAESQAGFYWYKLYAKDKNGNETTVGPFMIRVTTPAPVITRVSAVESDSDVAVGKYISTVGGEKTKWKNKIEINSSENSFTLFRYKAPSNPDEAAPSNLNNYEPVPAYNETSGEGYIVDPDNEKILYDTIKKDSTITSSAGDITYYYYVKDGNQNPSNTIECNCLTDSDVPGLTIIKPEAGKTFKNSISSSPYQFKGTAQENKAISGIYYKVVAANSDGTYTAPAANLVSEAVWTAAGWNSVSTGLSWEFYRNIGSGENYIAEGKHKVYMYVVDAAGNVSDVNLSSDGKQPYELEFHVDTGAPTVSFTPTSTDGNTNPVANTYRNNGFTLEVSAADTYGLKQVDIKGKVTWTSDTAPANWNAACTSYYTDEDCKEAVAADTAYAAGTYYLKQTVFTEGETRITSGTYSKVFKARNDSSAATDVIPLADGTYTFWTSVTDLATKTTTSEERKFTVDTVKPTGTLTAPAGNTVGEGAAAKTWYKSTSIRFEIEVNDPNIDIVEITKDNINDSTNTPVYEPMSLSNGKYTATLTDFTAGEKTITVHMKDRAQNENTTSKTIYIDLNAPELSVTNKLSYMPPEGFSIGGTASDNGTETTASGIADLIIKEEKKSSGSFAVTTESGENGLEITVTNGSWSKPLPFGTLSEGEYRYTITLKDNAGNTATDSFTTTVDTTAPTLAFTNPTGKTGTSAINSSPYMFSGSVTEANTISAIYYKLVPANSDGTYTAPTAPSGNVNLMDSSVWTSASEGWTPITAEKDWSFYRDIGSTTGAISEGKYKIYMYALDGAGNLSDAVATTTDVKEPYEREFHVDMAAPGNTISAPNSNTYRNQGFSVGTTATDSYGVESIELKGSVTLSAQPANWTNIHTNYYSDEACQSPAELNFTARTYYIKDIKTVTTATPVTSETYSKTFRVGSETTPDEAMLLADGTYNFTVTVKDLVGKTTSETRNFTIDTVIPMFEDSLQVKGTAWSDTNYYKDTTLKMSGNFTDATSGVDTLYYYVQDPGRAAPTDTTDITGTADDTVSLSQNQTDNTKYDFNFTVVDYKNNTYSETDGTSTANTLYIQAVDKAGNKSAVTHYTVNVDTTEPVLETKFYKIAGDPKPVSSTVYVKAGATTITIYGNYKDVESGVKELASFMVGDDSVTPEITYSSSVLTDETSSIPADNAFATYKSENAKKIRSFKVVLNLNDNAGKLEFEGRNGTYTAGSNDGKKAESPFTIRIDSGMPSFSNISITPTGSTVAYKKTVSGIDNYYVNNSSGTTFTFAGIATDNFGVDSVKLEILKPKLGANGQPELNANNEVVYERHDEIASRTGEQASEWSFESINLTGLYGTPEVPSKAILTVTDVAGNETEKELNLVFDTTAPRAMHWADSKNKDVYFRIGNADNERKSTDTTSADYNKVETGDDWDENLDVGVGSKYAFGSYGKDSTIELRGTFEEKGSGLKAVHYKIFSAVPDSTAISTLGTLENPYDGDIAVIADETRRVPYNTATTKELMSVTSNFHGQIPGFDGINNYLVLVAEDNVGNPAVDALAIYGGPEATPVTGDSKWNSADHNTETAYFSLNKDTKVPVITTTTSTQVTDGSREITVTGTVSDIDAGVKSVTVSIDETINSHTITYTGEATVTATDRENEVIKAGTWSVTIPADTFNVTGVDEGSITVYATAKDYAGAGNTKTISAATVIIDKQGPELVIDTDRITDADETREGKYVNGTINIKGTASDTNGIRTEVTGAQTLQLYYITPTAAADGSYTVPASSVTYGNTETPTIPTEIEKSTTATDSATKWIAISTAKTAHSANWTIPLDTTAIASGTTIKTAFLIVEGYDAAGNVGYSAPVEVIVDQDTDRPVITLSGPSNIEALSSGSVNWESREITGTVSDDDVISYIGYSIETSITSAETAAEVTYNELHPNNGIWRVVLSDDGANNLFFKVTAGGKDYYANLSNTYNDATVYDETNGGTYKLTDGSHKFGYRPASGSTTEVNKLALVIDTTDPDVLTAEFTTDISTDDSTPPASDSWATGIASKTFGGTLKRKFKIRQSAWDKNGVKSMSVKVIETINGTDSPNLKFEQTIDAKYATSLTETNGNSYLRFTSATISTKDWPSTGEDTQGNVHAYRLEIKMFDGIRSTVTKIDLNVDNTPPTVSFTGPASQNIQSGGITVNGTSSENGKVYYTVSTYGDATHKPEAMIAAGQKLTSWTGYTVSADGTTITPKNPDGTIAGTGVSVPAYTLIPNTSNLTWTVSFDGDTSDTLHAHSSELKHYAQSLGLTDDLENFTDLVNFYIWIKAEDSVGNSKEYSHLVKLDPQGDRPVVALSNPEEPDAVKGAATVGGTIKLYGTAEDSNGSVEGVWIQLLSAKNGGTTNGYGAVTVTGNNITTFAPTANDVTFWLEKNYPVYYIASNQEPVELKLESNTTNTTATVFNSSTHTPTDCYIKANLNGASWNLKINKDHEFDAEQGATSANDMAIRVYARDNAKNMSYPVTRYFKVDRNSPQITNVVLKQYAATDTTFASPLASQEARQGMYVKGKWYLEFTVTDDDSIESIVFLDSNSNETTEMSNATIDDVSVTEGVQKQVRYMLPTDIAGVGVFKRTIKASDNLHNGTYELEINYDNEAPKLLKDSSEEFDIESTVRQNHGFYKLYSKVSDATNSTTGTPSGVKAVGFYFMQRKSDGSEGLVYDPLQKRADPISTTNLQYHDGLYWLNGNITCNESGSITLGSDWTNKLAYVHAGSYIRLDGVMYKIVSVAGSTVTIDESHGDYSTAQIALAQFVDNRKSEYEGSTTKDSTTGYYTDIRNDDGDSMVEELGGTKTVSSWQSAIVSRNIPDGPIEIHYTAYDESMNYALGVVGNTSKTIYDSYTTAEAVDLNSKTLVSDGQYASYVYTYNSESRAYISNNAPRLAGVTVAIDYTGSGNYNTATKTSYYFQQDYIRIDNNGTMEKKPVAVTNKLEVAEKIKDANGNVTAYKGVNTIKGKTWIVPEMVGGNGKLWYSYSVYESGTNGAKNDTSAAKKSSGTTATYFADGTDEYDEYEATSYGSAYVDSHSSSKVGADGTSRTTSYIIHDTSFFTGTEGTGDATIAQPLWFDYTIYDSTETPDATTATTETLRNNQKATISIAMAVELTDGSAPNVVFNDLYWKDKSDNSVYLVDGKPQGHVELRGDLVNSEGTANCELGSTYGIDDDKVSGIIKFTGYAWDNKCLSELNWAIVENDTAATGAYSNPTYKFGAGMQKGAKFEDGDWTSIATSDETRAATLADDYYTFVVSDSEADGAYHNMNGHKVKWTLTVDTSHITGVVAEDLRVVVQATDTASTVHSSAITNNETTSDANQATDPATYDNETSRPTYKVDVVPYISEIVTSLTSLKRNNPSVYTRTARGHYTLKTGETITFEGFNLPSQKSLPIDSSTSSGLYNGTVNGLRIINNINNNDAKGSYTGTVDLTTNPTGSKEVYDNYYNRKPNGDNNNLLTDDIYFDIWEIDSNAAVPFNNKGKIAQAVMKVNPVTDQLGFAFASSSGYFSMAGKTIEAQAGGAANWNRPAKNSAFILNFNGLQDYSYAFWCAELMEFHSVGFTYDKLGHSYGVAAGGNVNAGNSTAVDFFDLFTDRWGKGLGDVSGNDDHGHHKASKSGYNAIRLEKTGIIYNGNTIDPDRFHTPSIVTATHSGSDDTSVYLAYYDAITGEIRFRAGNTANKDNNNSFFRIGSISSNYYTLSSAGLDNNILSDGNRVKVYSSNDDSSFVAGPYIVQNYVQNSKLQLVDINGTIISEDYSNHYLKLVPEQSKGNFGTFVDMIGTGSGKNSGIVANNYTNVAVIAGNSGRETCDYYSLGVVPGATASADKVFLIWYDENERALFYSYASDLSNTNLKNNQTAAGWTTKVRVFDANGAFETAGEYCKIAVDENGGVHIAALDPSTSDLVYAYLAADKVTNPATSDFKACVVDSNGIVGDSLTIDVAFDGAPSAGGKAIPRIGYYSSSTKRPKLAYLVKTDTVNPAGAVGDAFTGFWECTVVPSSYNLDFSDKNLINVGVFKDSNGVIKPSATTRPSQYENYLVSNESFYGSHWGIKYGNGTSNAVLGYVVKINSSLMHIETAQMK